jgi:hypothetical protein
VQNRRRLVQTADTASITEDTDDLDVDEPPDIPGDDADRSTDVDPPPPGSGLAS